MEQDNFKPSHNHPLHAKYVLDPKVQGSNRWGCVGIDDALFGLKMCVKS